jgi:hypothetical protein
MRPLGFSLLDTDKLLEHGVILWPDGRSLMKHGKGYLLRTPECEICFRWYCHVESYLAFATASFQHIIVDAEDAKQERIQRGYRSQGVC